MELSAPRLPIIELLLADGWQVVAMCRSTSNIQPLNLPGVTLVEGSLIDPDAVLRAMPKQLDAVFHLAASTNLWSPRNRVRA